MNAFVDHVKAFLFFLFILILGAVLMGVNTVGDEGFNAGIMLITTGAVFMVFDLSFFVRVK